MARFTLFRRRPQEPPPPAEGDGIEAPPPDGGPSQTGAAARPQLRRPPYHPGMLRRERRALVRAREERIRDLGGLILEMFRRDRFREDLMREQAQEIFGMEARIQEIDALLTTTREQVQTSRCECGAPLVHGAHFCANCGRPTGEVVIKCSDCGHPLPADARFCVNCAAPAPSAAERREAYPRSEVKPKEAPVEGEAEPASEPDPWER